MTQSDAGFFMNQYLSSQVATKDNKWQGRNVSRWRTQEYDDVHKQADGELDVVKRAAMYIKLNDLVVADNYIQPLLRRPKVSAVAAKLKVPLSGWDNDLWQIADWYRDA
jgi:peptide/nickel transport system substrate-binding protein